MSVLSRVASLMLAGVVSAVCVIGAPPGQRFAQAPAARIPGYTPPSHFPAPLGLRPTTSGFTGINPGALPTRPYGFQSGYRNGGGARGRGERGIIPFSYFSTPYYYPGLINNYSGYDSEGYGGFDNYAGPDPVSDSLAAGQGYLGRQIQQLSEQVDQLQGAQQSMAQPANPAAPPAPPQPERPPVKLVLLNGQELTVKSYAIMAGMFWDFTNPLTKKIPIANIDIAASARATEAQGGEFPTIGQ